MALSESERRRRFEFIAEDLKNGGKIFGTKATNTIEFKDILEYIKQSEDSATLGKYLVKI